MGDLTYIFYSLLYHNHVDKGNQFQIPILEMKIQSSLQKKKIIFTKLYLSSYTIASKMLNWNGKKQNHFIFKFAEMRLNSHCFL